MRASYEQRRQEFMSVWDQDSKELGQILHAHLVVEYFLTEHLKHIHPTLDLIKLRLNYKQKVGMIPPTDAMLSMLKPGLSALGSIRNKAAHVRRAQISDADVQPILKLDFYVTMTGLLNIDLKTASATEVYLSFARWAADTLHSATGSDNEKWNRAFDPAQSIEGFEKFLPQLRTEEPPSLWRKKRSPPGEQ